MLLTKNWMKQLATSCSMIMLTVGLFCGLQPGARAQLTLYVGGPATVTSGTTETITGSITGAADNLSEGYVFLSVDSYPPAFSDPSDFSIIGPPYDYSLPAAGGDYTGDLFDLSVDPSTPTGVYDLSFTLYDLQTGDIATPQLDLQQTVVDGVQGPGPSSVPEPSPLFSLMLLSMMCLSWIALKRLRFRPAEQR